jgi:hypothetical protein
VRRNAGLKQEASNGVVYSADHAFGLAILRRGIRTGHAKVNTISKEESTGARVIELKTIITLDALYSDAELCADISKKVRKSRESVRLLS